jgi:hypothetical protein
MEAEDGEGELDDHGVEIILRPTDRLATWLKHRYVARSTSHNTQFD